MGPGTLSESCLLVWCFTHKACVRDQLRRTCHVVDSIAHRFIFSWDDGLGANIDTRLQDIWLAYVKVVMVIPTFIGHSTNVRPEIAVGTS